MVRSGMLQQNVQRQEKWAISQPLWNEILRHRPVGGFSEEMVWKIDEAREAKGSRLWGAV
jgi:hypothetical protein